MSVKSKFKAAGALVVVKTQSVREEFQIASKLVEQDEMVHTFEKQAERHQARVEKAKARVQALQEELSEARTEVQNAKDALRVFEQDAANQILAEATEAAAKHGVTIEA